MKKFAIKLLLIVVPVFAVIAFVEIKLEKVKNSFKNKKECLLKVATQVNTIVLGSSQSYYGINPSYFTKKTFNLANSSQSIYYDKEILLKTINQLPNLKNVILPISYFSLYYNLDDGKEGWRKCHYKKFWDIKSPSYNAIDINNYSLLALYTPKVVLEMASKGFAKTDLSEGVDDNGFLQRDSVGLNARISNAIAKERYAYHLSVMNKKNTNDIVTCITEMMIALQQKHINIYFVTPPVYKTYSQYLDINIVQKNDSIINAISKKYSCIYNNFSNDARFIKEDFYDNDHLNVYGATKFSKILDSIIEHHN